VIDPVEDPELLPPADAGELPELLEQPASAQATSPAAITAKRRKVNSYRSDLAS
jgi:hypothetical protein